VADGQPRTLLVSRQASTVTNGCHALAANLPLRFHRTAWALVQDPKDVEALHRRIDDSTGQHPDRASHLRGRNKHNVERYGKRVDEKHVVESDTLPAPRTGRDAGLSSCRCT
jgi:hypothetical protein